MPVSIGPALADALRITFDDASADWFPPIRPSIDSLAAPDAARPGCDGNAPWNVLDHLRIGFAVWGEYLATGRFDPARFGGGGEWERIPEPSETDWARLRAETVDLEAAFRAVVARMSDDDLLARDSGLGGATRLEIVLSTLAHAAFHAGELATLRAGLDGETPAGAHLETAAAR